MGHDTNQRGEIESQHTAQNATDGRAVDHRRAIDELARIFLQETPLTYTERHAIVPALQADDAPRTDSARAPN
ncbi:MAG: hypothetical protein ACREPM_05135 [Gemmatimonadaceae bacterium]